MKELLITVGVAVVLFLIGYMLSLAPEKQKPDFDGYANQDYQDIIREILLASSERTLDAASRAISGFDIAYTGLIPAERLDAMVANMRDLVKQRKNKIHASSTKTSLN